MKLPQTILITGCTAGIGRAAAITLAAEGHTVLATGRNRALLEQLVSDAGGRIHAIELDVTDPRSVTAAVAEVERFVGERGLDVLVNNAGYGQPGALLDLRVDDLRRQFETNVFGLHAVTVALVPLLRRGSRIVNVSSLGGRITFPLFGAYHASKYAVEALSDALRMELAPLGIHVALIEPGPVRSQFGQRAMSGIEAYRGDSLYEAVYRQAERVQAAADAQSSEPEVVVRALRHAVNARRPRVRYVTPRHLLLVVFFANLLPTRLIDWLMNRFMGIGAVRAPSRALPASRRAA